MKRAIKKACPDYDLRQLRPMLWKDELGDITILTKHFECYLWSKNKLRVMMFKWLRPAQRAKLGPIFNEIYTDDHIHAFTCDLAKLTSIIALGGRFRKRPYVSGEWMCERRLALGHEFAPFNPEEYDITTHAALVDCGRSA